MGSHSVQSRFTAGQGGVQRALRRHCTQEREGGGSVRLLYRPPLPPYAPRGTHTRNVEPRPASLSTLTAPPNSSSICRTI